MFSIITKAYIEFWKTARKTYNNIMPAVQRFLKPKIGRTQTRINYSWLPSHKTIKFKEVRQKKGKTNLY